MASCTDRCHPSRSPFTAVQEENVPDIVSFTAPRTVALVPCDPQPLTTGSVRISTWYSGISAGTELTAYRGSNPYLTSTWDADRRLFVEGVPTFGYPIEG